MTSIGYQVSSPVGKYSTRELLDGMSKPLSVGKPGQLLEQEPREDLQLRGQPALSFHTISFAYLYGSSHHISQILYRSIPEDRIHLKTSSRFQATGFFLF